ncbi:MAG: RNA polymerase sigma factor [Myxococcota bacterium]
MNHHLDPALGASPQASNLSASLVEHQGFVRRIAIRLTGDPSEADDAIQDTWVRALERRPSLSRRLGPWLEASIRGIIRNRRRAANRRTMHEQVAARPEVAPTEQLALRQRVVDAVLALDEPYRRTVVMAYQEGLDTAEIAEREGVAAGTVRTRLHRAHARLRERIGDSDDRRSQLAALALALPPGATRSVATGPGAALGQAGGVRFGRTAIARSLGLAATVVAAPVAVWSLWAGSESSTTAEPRPIAVEAVAAAALASGQPALTAIELTAAPSHEGGGERRALVPDVPVDAAYWQAVRTIRAGLPRYTVPESEPSAALRRRFEAVSLASPPLAPAALAAISSQANAEWIVPPRAMPAPQWLSLVVSLHGSGLQWEIFDDAVLIAPIQELLTRAQPFDHRIDDLLHKPGPYFEGGVVPSPLYPLVPNADDLLVSLVDGMADRHADDVKAEVLFDPNALRWSHTPRQYLRVQQYLDQVRSFRQPLPEHGVPGTKARVGRTDADRRALAALRCVGGTDTLLGGPVVLLVDELRKLGVQHSLGVLWTSAAREQIESPERLSLDIFHGCIVLREEGEAIASQPSTLWMDLRVMYQGHAIDPVKLAESPELLILVEKGHAPELTTDFLVAYLTRFVASETWNEDPRNTMRVTQESQLIVHQSPRVLDEIEQAVVRLSAFRQ